MIITTQMLLEKYHDYTNPQSKIKRLKDKGEIFYLTRGLYETDKNAPGHCLAGAIYGPSYLSFDYALSRYGLIPEAVYAFTSATFEKKKAKKHENHFGTFLYRDIPSEAYPLGITIKEENGYFYQIADPEKALCDKLYTMPPVTSRHELEKMLFEDLRIYADEFAKLNRETIMQIGDKYHCNNLKYLIKYLKRSKK